MVVFMVNFLRCRLRRERTREPRSRRSMRGPLRRPTRRTRPRGGSQLGAVLASHLVGAHLVFGEMPVPRDVQVTVRVDSPDGAGVRLVPDGVPYPVADAVAGRQARE